MSKCCISLGILQMSIVCVSGAVVASECSAEPPVSDAIVLGISVPKKTFVQAEPVPMRTEIRNRSEKPVEVMSDLEPTYGILRFRVTDPEGRTSIPEPASQYKMERLEETTLDPEDKLVYTALLPFGADRSVFEKVGRYSIQALYRAKSPGLASKAITITVVAGDGVDPKARDLFTGQEQGKLASGRGASQAAVDSFRRILRKYPTSVYAPYAAYYLGSFYHRHEEYEQSIALFERIVKDYSNFPLDAELRYRLAIAYKETGREDQAKKLLADLIAKEPHDLFARRGERLLRELESE